MVGACVVGFDRLAADLRPEAKLPLMSDFLFGGMSVLVKGLGNDCFDRQ